MLRYLAEHSLRNPGAPLKEHQIASEVFGRPANFDPRLDSTVRVQTGRLRSKLASYYHGPGADDPIIVEIPRGAYLLTFQSRHEENAQPAAAPPEAASDVPAEPQQQPSARGWIIAFGMMTAVALALVAFILVGPAWKVSPVSRSEPSLVLRHFWAPFLDNSSPAWAVFSNAEFAGRPDEGMRYYDPARDAGKPILDYYTGVGEVLAVHELDRVFAALNQDLRVKRGRLLSLDDVKNNDLVFVGSPRENLTLRDVPSSVEFTFQVVPDGRRKGELSIVNAHPQPGEQQIYMTNGFPLTEDYSVIALVPGLNPAHRAMILAGITTLGTQAAVEFVCRESSARTLLERVSGSVSQDIRPFEALLHVSVRNGVPVRSDIVAVHLPKASL